jgi:hypothetical protein
MNSLKKIAVVLAAALSFGTLSVIPSNAVVLADSFAIDAASDTIMAGETATAVLTLTFIAENSGDTVSVLSLVTSQPTAANKTATLTVAETTSAVVSIGAGNTSADVSSTTNSATQVTAKLTASLVAPTVAGTYVVNFYPVLKSTGGKVTSIPLAWTVTVNAPDLKASAATSTSFINKGETISATADDKVFAPKTVSADAAAIIVVTQKNATGATASESLTVTVSGPGLLGHGTDHTTITALGRAIVVPAGSYIGVFSDGTAGVVSNSATSATIIDGVAKFNLVGVKTGTAKVGVYSGTIVDTVTVRVEGSAAKVAISFDKDQYTPGEAATITVSITDADGLPLSGNKTFSNLFATGGITSSYAFGSGSDVINVTSVTTDTKTATKTFKVFMPNVEVNVNIFATGGTSLLEAGRVLISDSATVFDPARKASDEALNAAREATDAAVLAQEAADRAADAAIASQETAQSAVNAVLALSVKVAKLVTQFGKIKNLINKVAKRIGVKF